jgi:hypothetical protein
MLEDISGVLIKLLSRNSGLQPLYINLCRNIIYCIDLAEDVV